MDHRLRRERDANALKNCTEAVARIAASAAGARRKSGAVRAGTNRTRVSR
jgi:hypothetical protein